MQAADFLDDQSTVEKLCQYAGTWLFDRHTENAQHDKEHQQQNAGSPRISEERLQVRFWSPWVGELSSHDHLSLQAVVPSNVAMHQGATWSASRDRKRNTNSSQWMLCTLVSPAARTRTE